MGPRRRVGDDLDRRGRVDRLVERDRDIGAERLLDGDGMLGRESMGRAVQVRPEGHAVIVDDAQIAERHHLEAAGVGEDRAIPVHEPVQAAEALDPLVSGAQVQVVRVREDDRRPGLADLRWREGLDRRVGPDRHELGRLDDAMRQGQESRPGRASCRRPGAGR